MAKISDFKINVHVSISEETIVRCCMLLSLYLSDNPNKTMYVSESCSIETGERCVEVCIDDKEEGSEEDEQTGICEDRARDGDELPEGEAVREQTDRTTVV